MAPATDDAQPVRVLPVRDAYANGTAIERRLYDALDALRVRYEPQWELSLYRVDAYLPGYRLAVEANGCVWHACATCGFDTPAFDAAAVKARQARRDERLWRWFGVRTLHIFGHELTSGADAIIAVRAALVRAGVRVRARPERSSEQ